MKYFKQHGRHMMTLMLAFTAASVLLLWSWNSVMPMLFELPDIQFKQAVALLVLIAIPSALFRSRHRHSAQHETVQQQ